MLLCDVPLFLGRGRQDHDERVRGGLPRTRAVQQDARTQGSNILTSLLFDF